MLSRHHHAFERAVLSIETVSCYRNCELDGDLLKVAFDTNREHTDVLAVRSGLLNKSCVDNFFIFTQSATAAVTHLESSDQLINKLVSVGSGLLTLLLLNLVDNLLSPGRFLADTRFVT